MRNKNLEAKSLYDLYKLLDLRLDLIDPTEGFTIHNMKDIGLTVPYQSPSYRPDFFSFLFVKNGSGKYTVNEYTFNIQYQSIYFTNPSNYRTFSWQSVEEIYLITFDETFLKKYIGKDIFSYFPFLLTETIQPKAVTDEFYGIAEKIYLQILEEYKSRSSFKYKVIGHFLSVLLYKIKEYFWIDYNPLQEGNRSSQIVKSFKHLLESHYRDLSAGKADRVFRVQDYADAQNLHPNYLSNVIKSKTGKPIASWIVEKTISEAKSLLQNTSISIKEITYQLGFSEAAHFSNYFKKHTGITPVQYRKELDSCK
ncbi:AraC family transcriptional regulator [Chryseobacterium oranimense]|uniref:AraC family transcriptional regulator n=1 Tax=Chryseobacterium oranimense TaxID=421058 RepID=UPI00223559D8|nr:helix-turn-helix domain-containing protein [Chryseobacterium oranimense]